jgi:hypothetical protein
MYQPQVPFIEMSPRLRTRRLSEVELGRLVLLGGSVDESGPPGLGIRGDVLSRRGDVSEGVFRLNGGFVTFERRELNKTVVAIEVDYVLEADFASAAVRPVEVGDLVVSTVSAAAGIFVMGPWQEVGGLLDLGSAVARPVGPEMRDHTNLVLAWQLREREERSRVLFRRQPQPVLNEPRPRRPASEDCD